MAVDRKPININALKRKRSQARLARLKAGFPTATPAERRDRREGRPGSGKPSKLRAGRVTAKPPKTFGPRSTAAARQRKRKAKRKARRDPT